MTDLSDFAFALNDKCIYHKKDIAVTFWSRY